MGLRPVSKWILIFGVAFTAFAPIVIALKFNDTTTSWIAALCGAFITIMARFEDFVEVSLGPLKEKMPQTIDEANATIGQLRELASTIAEGFLTDLMASSFLGGMPYQTKFALHDRVLAALKRLHVPDTQIANVTAEWRKGIGLTYHNHIREIVELELKQRALDPARRNELSRSYNELMDFSRWHVASPNEIREFLRSNDLLTPAAATAVDEFQLFPETGEISRRAEFLRARQPV